MDEKLLALKIAETTLQNNQLNFWVDFIKIGIPSVVAIISTIVTCIISFKNNKTNQKIAELRMKLDAEINKLKLSHEVEKDSRQKKIILIEELLQKLSETYDASDFYLATLIGKSKVLSEGKTLPTGYEKTLGEEYLRAVEVKNKNATKIKALTLLLGNKDCIDIADKFHRKCIELLSNCNSSCTKEQDELLQYAREIHDFFLKLSSFLSELFWATEVEKEV